MAQRLEFHEDFKTVEDDLCTVTIDPSQITINITDGSGHEQRHVQRLSLDRADFRRVVAILKTYDALQSTLKGYSHDDD